MRDAEMREFLLYFQQLLLGCERFGEEITVALGLYGLAGAIGLPVCLGICEVKRERCGYRIRGRGDQRWENGLACGFRVERWGIAFSPIFDLIPDSGWGWAGDGEGTLEAA